MEMDPRCQDCIGYRAWTACWWSKSSSALLPRSDSWTLKDCLKLYSPLDIKNAKYLIVASSHYVYLPLSLFWPDVIFLTALKLDLRQKVGMAKSVQRVVNMDPQVIVIAGSNDHLESRRLWGDLRERSILSNEVMGEAIMTPLSIMTEAKTSMQRCFIRNVVKFFFVLSRDMLRCRNHCNLYTRW